MRADRRTFLQTTVSTAAALAISNDHLAKVAHGWQSTPKSRVRKDVATLTDASSDIVSLKKGVTAMKGLGQNDLRNWRKQAEIHGQILGGNFNHCQHGNWWFLSWHRTYLYYFEEIVRELSGDDDFALPYWDWSKEFSLPALFWGNNNPLSNPPRPGEPGSGRNITVEDVISDANQRRFVNQTVISRILRTTDFNVFAGEAAAMLGDSPGQGTLEGGPHNFIHRWVGGDMVTAGSPFDPIFWLHHCNIDRLWTEWVRRHPSGMPNDSGWLTTAFAGHFCDRKGGAITVDSSNTPITTQRVLKTESVGYVYDRRPTPIAVELTARDNFFHLAGPKVSRAAATFTDHAVDFKTVATGEFSGKVAAVADRDVPYSVRLRLSGVMVPADPNVSIDVYINCLKAATDLAITDASYAGSLAFFHGAHGDEGHGDVSFLIDLSPTIARLYADRPFKPDEPIKVTLVAEPLFPAASGAWKGTVQELAPGQVSLEVVGLKSAATD